MDIFRKCFGALDGIGISEQAQRWLPFMFFGIFIIFLVVICLRVWLTTRRKNPYQTECLEKIEECRPRIRRCSNSETEQKHASDAFLWSGIRR